MPIYEYLCESCGKEFEEWQKFSDPVVDTCPDCGGHSRRLISHSTFHLKGTGWYVTDYGKGSSAAGKTTVTKKDTPSESKPAESTSSKDA
jgi:putative FmdB family regulatory protein